MIGAGMRARLAALIVIVGLCLPAGALAQRVVDPATLPFSVTLPAGVTVVEDPGIDWMVYRFMRGTDPLLAVYAGMAPSFHPQTGRGAPRIQQDTHCYLGRYLGRDVLLDASQGSSSWFLHVWTLAETDETRPISVAILTSIRVPGRNDGVRAEALQGCPST